MSCGSRSLVNGIRRNVPEIPEERARASVVLPVPGTSSRRTWPPAMKDAIARSTASRFPRRTVPTFARNEDRRSMGDFPSIGLLSPARGPNFDKNPEWYLNGTPAFSPGRRNAGDYRPRCAAPGRRGREGTGRRGVPRRRGREVLDPARRALSVPRRRLEPFRSAAEVFERYRFLLSDSPVEVFVAVLLDVKHRPLREERVSAGILDGSLIHPREVFAAAVPRRAAAVLLLHNPPSGDPAPSGQDREVTRRLRSAGGILGIPVVDHVILGDAAFFSFREEGDWGCGARCGPCSPPSSPRGPPSRRSWPAGCSPAETGPSG